MIKLTIKKLIVTVSRLLKMPLLPNNPARLNAIAVTSNNSKASEVLRSQGYSVSENPVTVWYTENTPAQMKNATSALAQANINTYCIYSTTSPKSKTSAIVFNTSDAERTLNVLNRIG